MTTPSDFLKAPNHLLKLTLGRDWGRSCTFCAEAWGTCSPLTHVKYEEAEGANSDWANLLPVAGDVVPLVLILQGRGGQAGEQAGTEVLLVSQPCPMVCAVHHGPFELDWGV